MGGDVNFISQELMYKKEIGPKKFLEFRDESSLKLNDFCGEYYSLVGDKLVKDVEEKARHKIIDFFGVSLEESKIIDFVLRSFSEPKNPEKNIVKMGNKLLYILCSFFSLQEIS